VVKIKITTETVLEVIEPREEEKTVADVKMWQKKVTDFLGLVDKTLVQGVEFKSQKINSICLQGKIDRDYSIKS
jgi:hypothetical protein